MNTAFLRFELSDGFRRLRGLCFERPGGVLRLAVPPRHSSSESVSDELFSLSSLESESEISRAPRLRFALFRWRDDFAFDLDAASFG